MKFFYSMSLNLLFLFVLSSCNKDGQNIQSKNSHDVYIIGQQTVSFPTGATYWKNGSLVVLTDSNLVPQSIAVSGSDIYIGGWDRGNISVYYKNNIRNVLNWEIMPNSIFGLTISGDDIYITGLTNFEGKYAYLKNQTPVEVDWNLGNTDAFHASGTAFALGLAVSGSDVYIVGQVMDTISNVTLAAPTIAYWKNGKMNLLGPSSTFAQPTGIAVSGSNVYITANKRDTAMYWVNGVPITLGAGFTTSIFVSGNDVYISGNTNDGSAIYWKNGSRVLLAGNANTKGIVVSGNDIYVAGNLKGNYGVYWKNGVVDTLCTNGSVSGITLGD